LADAGVRLERFARIKYRTWPIEEPGSVLIRTEDVERLRRPLKRGDAG
jgi:hypothetical protein